MALHDILKKVEKFTVDNSPMILTIVGVAGVTTSAILAGKGAFKASDILHQHETNLRREGSYEPLTLKEQTQLTWKCYIPAVSTVAVTTAAIVASNQIGTRRAAAVAAAYSLSEKAFAEYREKVVEKMGENKERQVRDDIQQDRVKANPPSNEVVIMVGKQLCYDSYSGRYFQSDMESVKKAMNDLNHKIINDNYASLSDFYDLLGLERTSVSDEIGWNLDKLLDIHFTTTLAEDGRPAIALDYRVDPVRDYFRLR